MNQLLIKQAALSNGVFFVRQFRRNCR